MRKTKIVCTIGPACENEETLIKMAEAGMDVARLNFSHGTHEEHQAKIDLVSSVREKLGLPIAIMLDTKGPEYRIKTFENGKVTLEEGATFTLTTEDVEGNEERVAVNYENLVQELQIGDRVLINNGLVVLEVQSLEGSNAVCTVINGGVLSNRKSMNFPNKVLKSDYLSEQDKSDILFGIKNDVDFVAASFVSNKQDMIDLRSFLDENGGKDIEIIAKIENRSGVDNVEDILNIADGIMVARGDLGVEIPFMEVPSIQKELIKKCRSLGKRVITATEMLESMIYNPRPTRAEISDVANAVYDGTSAIMLSGETAAGKFPVEAVQNMAGIASYTEADIDYNSMFLKTQVSFKSQLEAISHATCNISIDLNAACICVCSISGKTARLVSGFRSPVRILGMTTSKKVWRKLNLCWGVTPVLSEEFDSVDVMFYYGVNHAKRVLDLQPGETIVLTGGKINGKSGNTNMIRVENA